MKRQTIKMLAMTSLLILLMSSCMSKEEYERRHPEEFANEQKVESQPEVKEEKKVAYFSSVELRLPEGVVLDFAPTDEKVDENHEKGVDEIYITIQDSKGQIHIEQIDYKTWLNLHPGDIIK